MAVGHIQQVSRPAGRGYAGGTLGNDTLAPQNDVPVIHLGTMVAVVTIMTAVCSLACLLPSVRASRVDPMEAIGYE